MDVTKLPSATYWFVLGFVRARLDDEDFKYLELVLSESIMEEHSKGQKGNPGITQESTCVSQWVDNRGPTCNTTILTTDNATSYELANNRIKNGLKPY